MNRVIVSFAAALMVGGSTLALAQQGNERGRPEAPGQSQASPPGRDSGGPASSQAGASERGAPPGPAQSGPARNRSSEATPPAQGKGPADRERQAQGKTQDEPSRKSDTKNSNDRDRQAETKGDNDKNRQAETKGDNEKNRQAETKGDNEKGKQAETRRDGDQNRTAGAKGDNDRNRETAQPARGPDQRNAAGATRDERREPMRLSDDQRKKVQREFRQSRERSKVRHYTNVDVDISIGRRAPRTWAYASVPSFIVDVAPRYRGYRYVWVSDRYYIVNPTTYEVVAYVDDDSGAIYASGGRVSGRHAAAGDRCEVSLTAAERRRILSGLGDRRPRRLPIADLAIGIDLPGGVELHAFPARLRRDFRDLEGCRYIPVAGDRVLIVEADTRRVVAIVER